jgi:hypothetical protein
MKKLLLFTLAALASSTTLYANIGDTLAQSNARYGEPQHHQGNLYYYVTGGYLIAELVDASTGVVEYIEYTKGKGVIDADETAKILSENLPAYPLQQDHWEVVVDRRGDDSRTTPGCWSATIKNMVLKSAGMSKPGTLATLISQSQRHLVIGK